MFETLSVQPTDSVLGLIKLYAADRNPAKIDLGVGVYRDDDGGTPIMQAVKAAELRLHGEQASKTYFGSEGDAAFLASVAPLALGAAAGSTDRITGCQSVGGTGALRLAATLAVTSRPEARIWVGTPTWPNHLPIFGAAEMTIETYTYFDPETQSVRFDEMVDALGRAKAGDVALLHACCHNPTGADLTPDQWRTIGALLERRGVVPLLDFAYLGFGRGVGHDAAGVETILEMVPEAMVAFSCSKNFGLYRERTGALFVVADQARAASVLSNLQILARTVYSTPPDHGAAVVRTILNDAGLHADWDRELRNAGDRLRRIRRTLAAQGDVGGIDFTAFGEQNGMFSLLPLTAAQVTRLREERSIYMAGSGRINVAGLTDANIPAFVDAVAAIAGRDVA